MLKHFLTFSSAFVLSCQSVHHPTFPGQIKMLPVLALSYLHCLYRAMTLVSLTASISSLPKEWKLASLVFLLTLSE
jgi:hypothetical protein